MSRTRSSVTATDGREVWVHRGVEDTALIVEGAAPIFFSPDEAAHLAGLLAPTAAEPAPAAAPGPAGAAADVSPRKRRRETVADLVQAGLLAAGAILVLRSGDQIHLGEVAADGRIDVDGELFDTPSGAAGHAAGGTHNGWVGWTVEDSSGSPHHGETLDSLRWRLRAAVFPPNADGLAAATVAQIRRIVSGWVDECLSRGRDPGVRDTAAVSMLLDSGTRSDRTLSSYRRHLDAWFDLYGPQRETQSQP